MISLKSTPPVMAWRCILLNLILLGLVGILSYFKLGDTGDGTGTVTALTRHLTSVFLLISWLAAIRFITLATWGRILALVWLLVALFFTQIWGNGGIFIGVFMSATFLLTRSYQAWRLISARRRAIGFGFGLVALVALFGSTGVWSTQGDDQALGSLDKLGVWSLASLIIFWFLSQFHLAVRMRLHFLRLRAKLAVSGILIGFVPLVLVVVLGALIFYSGLGGSRALRATNILESWRTMADSGNDLVGAPFDSTFCWPEACAASVDTNVQFVPAADWVPRLSALLKMDQNFGASADTTDWYLMDGDIWLLRWQDVGSDQERVRGWLLGQKPLTELSRMIKAGVELTNLGSDSNDGAIVINNEQGEDWGRFQGQRACYRDVSGDSSFWHPLRFFGGSLIRINHIREDELDASSLVVNLRVGLEDLKAEFLDGESNLNLVVVVVLSVVAFLFLTLEIFAFFFGVRISEGFVSAVHSLHKGTRALTRGELETVIDIPNEDEFGDLADSFNEMTVAIRQGREDALANERLTRELETARGIQERLLPSREPTLAGFEVTGASIPSREIGGDYFDFLIRENDSIGVAIGDVSGKGMPAALLMSNLQASLHGQVIHPSSVAQVVSLVNDLIVASTDSHMFATFFYGLIDTVGGTFTCTNAGHNPPMLFRADGSLEELKTGGLLLGMLAHQQYKQETVHLGPGDVVVLYTDGITEAVGPTADEDDFDAMFGEEALEEVVRSSSHLPAAGIKEAILDAVAQHTEGVAQSDDITLVVIRRQG